MNYEEWKGRVPREITDDALWRVEASRLALFVADVGWHDVTKLVVDRRTLRLADQLYRALGSISANLRRGIRGVRARIEHGSTNIHSDRPERVVTGISRVGTCWEILSQNIGCGWSPRLSACSWSWSPSSAGEPCASQEKEAPTKPARHHNERNWPHCCKTCHCPDSTSTITAHASRLTHHGSRIRITYQGDHHVHGPRSRTRQT